jgi:O-antigen ligase
MNSAGSILNVFRVSEKLALPLICCLVASLAFMRPTLHVHGMPLMFVDIFFIAIACISGIVLLYRFLYQRKGKYYYLVSLYFLTLVASAIFSRTGTSSFVMRLMSELYLVSLPVIISMSVVNYHDLRRVVLAWLAGTTAIVVIAVASLSLAMANPVHPYLKLVQHHLGSLPLGPFVRYKLTYNNPNMLGAYLTASLMMALLAAARGWIGSTWSMILISGIAMTMVATFSAGIGGGILGGAIWYWAMYRHTRPWFARMVLLAGIVVGIAFVLAQALTPVPYPHPLFTIALPGFDLVLSPASRMQAWIDALRTFAAHPITGVGVGMDVAHVRFVEPGGARVMLRDAHNVLFSVAASCGLLGVAALMAILIAVWRDTRSSIPQASISHTAVDLPTFAFGSAILNILVYQGIGGSFEDARFVWVMIGFLIVARRLRETADDDWIGAAVLHRPVSRILLPGIPLR